MGVDARKIGSVRESKTSWRPSVRGNSLGWRQSLVTWGRWLLGDRATRTISPFSKITVPEYIENRIKEKTPQSLNEAEQLAVGNAELLQRISEARTTLTK